MQNKIDISIVLGSKNRKNLLKATIESVRNNGFKGEMEIIVIDGGSTDGTCDWLAKQADILTIIQPNYKIVDDEGISILAHSWGEFMNIGFKYARSKWVVMISDDLILMEGCLQNAYEELSIKISNGEKIGGGAFYFREYPRHDYYRVGLLANDYIVINHGFYNVEALDDISFIEEKEFNFYCADGDLIMRMNNRGWRTIALENSLANHLVHFPNFKKNKVSRATERDIKRFNEKYPVKPTRDYIVKNSNRNFNYWAFWLYGFKNCLAGLLLKYYDSKNNK
jgi:glycosyltransferase involved in cell wall biosynthesis